MELHKSRVRFEQLIHSIFGPASLPYLHRAGLTSSPFSYCIGCSSGKFASSSKGTSINPSTTTTYIATQPLEKLHMDTVRPFVLSIDQMKYFVTVVDDYTNYSWTLPVRRKSEVATVVINLVRRLNTRF